MSPEVRRMMARQRVEVTRRAMVRGIEAIVERGATVSVERFGATGDLDSLDETFAASLKLLQRVDELARAAEKEAEK